jgi:hypothetical protein
MEVSAVEAVRFNYLRLVLADSICPAAGLEILWKKEPLVPVLLGLEVYFPYFLVELVVL